MANNLPITPIKNDITMADRDIVSNKITSNAQFSLSFAMLLIASTIICSLGLLMNSIPIVIGGMIIAPLMWPLMKVTLGVTLGKQKLVLQALSLFGISVVVSLGVAALITLVSPLKAVTNEILIRAQPTILDILIALAAGGIAALAITKKKISESLAGVAIATSLMPPLCVSGIGLALLDIPIATGAFLLFLSNVISIIFIAAVVFMLVGVRLRKEKTFTVEALILIASILVLVSIPLYILFQNYSFQTTAHQTVQKVLKKSFTKINRLIVVQNIKTTVGGSETKNAVSIEADVLVPEQVSIDYKQKQDLIQTLQNTLNRPVELNLHIQKTITLESETKTADIQKTLTQAFQEIIAARTGGLSIESLDIYQQNNKWVIDATLIADPEVEFSETHRAIAEQLLGSKIGQPVALNIDLIPRIKLQSEPDVENEQIRQNIYDFLAGKGNDISITAISVVQKEDNTITIKLDLQVPRGLSLSSIEFTRLKNQLQKKYKRSVTLTTNIVEKSSYTF